MTHSPGRPGISPAYCCLVLLLLHSPTSVYAAAPTARWGHVSALCGSMLYIHGGHTGVNPLTAPVGGDLYSLDISQPFNTFSAPWQSLSPGPYAAYHSMSLSGSGNSLLAIFGGVTSAATPPTPNGNSLYTYDTNTKIWTTSTLRDPPRRQRHTAVTKLDHGSMYFFGGAVLDASTNGVPTLELWALGRPLVANSTTSTPGLTPRSSSWEQLASPSSNLTTGSSNIGTSRTDHSATILRSNGLMVVVGGIMDGGVLASMSEILVYDTTSGQWSVQTATGATPPPRMRHAAAATKDGLIYVHGGTDMGGTNYFSDMAILDTASWTWRQPAFEGTAPSGRHSHAATMVGSNMLLTFGLTAGGAVDTVSVLDTTTNSWVPSYTPSNLAFTSTKPEDWPGYQPLPDPLGTNGTNPPPTVPGQEGERNQSPSLAPILGSVFGLLCASLVVLAVIRYRRKIQHQKRSRPIDTSFYGAPYSASMWQELDRVYAPTGLSFERQPQTFKERIRNGFSATSAAVSGFWSRHIGGGGGSGGGRGGWRWRKGKKDRSHVFRILDRNPDGSLQPRGPGTPWTPDQDPMNSSVPTDQELFLDAVKRARSRGASDAPVFAPLQPPLSPTSPNKVMSFQFPPSVGERDDSEGPVEYHGPDHMSSAATTPNRMSVGAGSLASSCAYRGGSDNSSCAVTGDAGPYAAPFEPDHDQLHGRTYSDGFENSMATMDVQMVSVPRGRLFVVNPSEDELEHGDAEDSGQSRELEPLHKAEGKQRAEDVRYVHFDSGSL